MSITILDGMDIGTDIMKWKILWNLQLTADRSIIENSGFKRISLKTNFFV